MKKIVILGIALIVFAGALTAVILQARQKQPTPPPVLSHKDATYIIDGKSIKLNKGIHEEDAAPGSATKIVTKYFGNEVVYDFDKDGRNDVTFIITQETGGSGTFFYVVTALNKEGGYVGSHALLLGDRISPQSTNMGKDGIVVVNYATRKEGESFAEAPSVGKSIALILDVGSMKYGEVAQDFEGEADPAKMNLEMKSWEWIKTTYANKDTVEPKRTGVFSITLNKNGEVAVRTDCNSMSGTYSTKDNTLTFGQMMSTLMFCEASQESEFAQMLSQVETYQFTSKGELILSLNKEGGTMLLR